MLVNSNPETVSTDYDTSDRLYLEPLVERNVLEVCELEQPARRRRLVRRPDAAAARARARRRRACRCSATRSTAIDAAEDRGRFAELAGELAPDWGARRRRRARRASVADELGYPVLVRPHYVIGGRGMHVARAPERAARRGARASIDRYLEGAIELDLDALCDGEEAWVAAVLEHVEPTGRPLGRLGLRAARALGQRGARGWSSARSPRGSRAGSERAA